MANLNIKFNNKSYSIDSSLLADATASLEAHLTTMAGGEGGLANIYWDGNIDGRENVDGGMFTYVKMSDEFIPMEKLYGATVTIETDGVITDQFVIDQTNLLDGSSDLGFPVWQVIESSGRAMAIAGFDVDSFDLSGGEGYIVTRGVYFTQFGSMHTSSLEFVAPAPVAL